MPLPLRKIEELIGRLARKSAVASTAYGRSLKEKGVGWSGVGHGNRSASPPLIEMNGLLLGMLTGPPADAAANLEKYGSLQRLDTEDQLGLDEPMEATAIREAAEILIANTLLESMTRYAEAFAGPSRRRLDVVTATMRLVKDDVFPYAVVKIIDGRHSRELAYKPAGVELSMMTRERTVEEAVTVWPAVFRGLADLWLATRPPTAERESADALAGAPARIDEPSDTGRTAHRKTARHHPQHNACVCENSSPVEEGDFSMV